VGWIVVTRPLQWLNPPLRAAASFLAFGKGVALTWCSRAHGESDLSDEVKEKP
jgi:hypothetical protein